MCDVQEVPQNLQQVISNVGFLWESSFLFELQEYLLARELMKWKNP